ncbi:hypothetical protein LXT21_38335 [Myxococcus sp. K38C18041901]|uniref:hypothetical protein n=1 Tax=Myxococcus guangdongensis TaxID=2906760 RepID=UPI0020A7AFF4|nr:hypothetical protein [Myxococcus guangdongensis]MCP3064646.1 hypothetical protein [Myxococcus guangdongensis]
MASDVFMSEKALRERLGDFESAPSGTFADGTIGHALQNEGFKGLIFKSHGISFEVLGTNVYRRPGKLFSSPQIDWAILVDYKCDAPLEIPPHDKVYWDYFEPCLLLPLAPIETVQKNFEADDIHSDPSAFRLRFLRALTPDVRPDTLPHWLEHDFLKTAKSHMAVWASAEANGWKAHLYCDQISPRAEKLFSFSIKSIQRLELQFEDSEPVVREQELFLGRLYPEAFLAPPPTSKEVEKFLAELSQKQSKKLLSIVKKLGKTEPSEWMPHDVSIKPNPIALLQKHLKIESVMRSQAGR